MPRRRATPARGLRRPTLPAPPHLAPGALTLDPLAASSYCAGARAPRPPRLRLGLWLGPPCCRPPARPRAPAAPPRRRTRPAAAAPTTNHRAEGAEPAAHQTRPIQPVPRACERPRGSAGDWSGLLKELRRGGQERSGRPEVQRVTWPSPKGRSKEFLSPNEAEALTPVFLFFFFFHYLISSSPQFSNKCLQPGGKPRLQKIWSSLARQISYELGS